MKARSILLMIFTVITKVFGLAREKALAHFFGTSNLASIFLVAFSLPLLISNLLSGSLGTGYIPIYGQVETDRGEDEANLFTAKLANIVALVALALSILAIVFARPLVKLMSPGFTGQVLDSAVYMSRLALASVFATALAAIFRAYLQIKGHFLVSISHSVFMNIILIGAMALSGGEDIRVLGLGLLLAFVLQYLIFIPFVRASGYRHTWAWDPASPHIKALLLMIIPILVSSSVVEVSLMVNKALASSLDPRGISVINYASKIQSFVSGIVITSIITVVYPRMSQLGAGGEREGMAKISGDSVSMMALLVIPASIGLLVFSEEIVSLLFLGGAFTAQDASITGRVLAYYALGLVALGVREILVRVFFSLKETRVPLKNALIILLANLALSLVLSRVMSFEGLGLAFSLSMGLGAVFLLIDLRKILGATGLRARLGNLIKIILASILMGLVARFGYRFLLKALSANLALLVAIGLAGIFYLVAIVLLRIDEVKEIIGLLRKEG